MKKVIDKLNELFDPFTWEITIKNNADEAAVFYVYVEDVAICSAYSKKELLEMLNDEKTLLGF